MIVPVINRFLHWSVIGVLSPVLVLMIMSKGIPVESVGIVMALMSASVVVLEVPSGILSDMIGRKRVYLLSIAIAIVALSVIFASRGILGVSIGFALYGMSRAFSSGSIESTFIDEFIARNGKEKLHRLISAMNAGEAGGLALGALVGGFVPIYWGKLFPLDDKYNGNIVLQITILLSLLGMTLCIRNRDAGNPHVRLGPFLREAGTFLRGNRIIRLMLAGVLFWGLTFNAIEVFWQPQLQNILGGKGGTWIFGMINSGYFLASIAGSLLVGAVLSKRKARNLVLIGCLRVATGLLLVGLSVQRDVPGFASVFLAIMCFNGMMNVPESTAFNGMIPDSKRASFLSFASLMLQLGGIAGSLLFSAAKRFMTINAIWIIAGAVFMASALVYFGANRESEKNDRVIRS